MKQPRLRRWYGTAGLACLVTLLGARPAVALDSFSGTRSDQLVERQHSAVLTLEPDHAELVVRRSFWNGSSVSDQAELSIELPEGAVATRLRTRGIGPGAPWFEGELLEAEEAARRYQELTGIGGHYPKDPALLSWREQGLLALQVFPCPPRAEKIIEYTLELPTTYEDGAFRVQLRALGTARLPARVQLVTKDSKHALTVDGQMFPSGATLPRPTRAALDIGLVAPLPLLDAQLVSMPFASGRVLTRYALRSAPRLSTLPRRAHVVIVLDASRSTAPDFEQAAKSAVDGYLAHLPDAQVEILTFDRRTKRELGSFRSSHAARAALRALTLQRKNGSDLDRALFEADQLLARAPRSAPRRVIVLSDGLSRQGLTSERLRGALAGSGAIVHLGLLHEGQPKLQRLDDHAWAEGIRFTGGLVWAATAPANAGERGELEATYEEWARPLRIDRLSGFSDNQPLVELLHTSTLAEGEGIAELYVDRAVTRNLSVAGELWSSIVRVAAEPERAQERLWSALIFGSPALWGLSEPEMMTLARLGRAVSPVTSYLAIEPGVRPSTAGLSDEERLGFGRSGVSVRMGGTKASGRAPHLDLQAFLETLLGPDLARCGGAAGTASIDVETTAAEIVAVATSAEPPDPLVESCLSEAAWALLLPAAFHEPWAQYRVEL